MSHSTVKSKQVATQFIKRYYTTLSSNPENLAQFYDEDSTYSRGIADSLNNETIVGSEQIGEYFAQPSLGLHNSNVEILGFDFQSSLSDSVIIMVTGVLKSNNQPSGKTFVETFFLAKNNSSYYVLNHFIRFIESKRETEEVSNIASEKSIQKEEQKVERVEEPQKEEIETFNNNVKERVEAEHKVVEEPKEIRPQEKKDAEVKVSETKPEVKREVVQPPKATVVIIPENKTYASILMRNELSPKSSTADVADSASVPTHKQNKPNKPNKPSNNNNANNTSNINKPQKDNFGKRNDKPIFNSRQDSKTSIFVKGLNPSIQKADIDEAFKGFGIVKSFRLQKNEKTGTVEFNSVDAQQRALNNKNPILIKGQEITIEPKRSSEQKNNNNNGVYRKFNRENK